MDGSAKPANAAAQNGHKGLADTSTELPQGTLGGRLVSGQSTGMHHQPFPAPHDEPPGTPKTAQHRELHSRRATAKGSTSTAMQSACVPAPGGQALLPSPSHPCAGSNHANTLERFLHPPDLQPTLANNARGITLFRGVRHGMLLAEGLDLKLLKQLPEDQLAAFCQRVHANQPNHASAFQKAYIQAAVRRIRSTSLHHANLHAKRLQGCAVERMAQAVAAEALAIDSNKCRQALDGNAVDLHLCAVSLFTPEAFAASAPQWRGFDSLTFPECRQLLLCDADGAPHPVRVRMKVRQFALSSVEEGLESVKLGGSRNCTANELLQLLGPLECPRVTGEAGAHIDAVNAQALQSLQVPLARALQALRASPGNGADHADLHSLRTRLAATRRAIEAEMPALTRNSRTLVEACRQLKAMWTKQRAWPPGVQAHRRAAALLLLAAHQMGETPLLSSTSPAVTAQLDAEVRFLAAYADDHAGHLPPPDALAPA